MFTETDLQSIKRLYLAVKMLEDQYISPEDEELYKKACSGGEEPHNQVDTIDTKPCGVCSIYKDFYDGFKFCAECGRALSE